MRIALVDPSLFTVPYDRALAGGLSAAGHEVTLHGRRVGPDDPDTGNLTLEPSFYRFTGSRPVARLPRRVQLGIKGLDHVASMIGLRGRLRSSGSDIIHFQWLPLPSLDDRLLAGFSALAPLVMTVHDTAPSNGDPAAAVRQRGFYASLKRFDAVIVHTEQGRARVLERGIREDRVALLPHGLLDELIAPPACLDAMDGEITFLLFGKIKPYKGADLLIEAFGMLSPALRSQSRVRIVGKPYMPIEPLEALAQRYDIADRVTIEPRFVAEQEIGALFSAGVVAVFPYREIEASGVLSLALGYARPVVASRIGNFAETLEDGKQGILVPIGDAAALSNALAKLITDRNFAAGCSNAARMLATTIPSWDVIGRQTSAIYEEATARFRSRTASR